MWFFYIFYRLESKYKKCPIYDIKNNKEIRDGVSYYLKFCASAFETLENIFAL
jgi:hypothetical protein